MNVINLCKKQPIQNIFKNLKILNIQLIKLQLTYNA